MPFEIMIRARDREPVYPRSVAMQLARISAELLDFCERERLVQAKFSAGAAAFSAADIRQLARIRRLHEQLELDLDAVEVVLHLRRQVVDLLADMEERERKMRRREQELLHEIRRLRRLAADEVDWQQR